MTPSRRGRGSAATETRRHEIAQARLRSQRLAGAPLPSASAVVRWLGAMQAQEYGVAKWSIGQRTSGASDAALDRALAEGSILRTHMLRPTWHFVLPEDIRWMLELTGPRVHKVNGPYYRQFELPSDILASSGSVIAAALEGGQQLTRKEIATLLERAGVRAAGPRLAYILMYAELNMLVCSGALRGKEHTYALFDERVPAPTSFTQEEALARLTELYFTGHGPATSRDFRWWSGLTAPDVKHGLALVGERLERRSVDERVYWAAPSSWSDASGSVGAHLLQGYDEYIVAYTESKSVIDVAAIAGRPPRGETLFTHAVIVEGQVLGHWRRTVKAKGVTIHMQPMRRLTASERKAVRAAGDRYGQFLGLPVTLGEGR